MSTIQIQSDKYSPKINPKIDPDIECTELLYIIKGLHDKYFEDDYTRSKLVSYIKKYTPYTITAKMR